MRNNNLTNLMINYNYYKANGLRFPELMMLKLSLEIEHLFLKKHVLGDEPYITYEQFKKSYLGE